jgi:hypothetical protein
MWTPGWIWWHMLVIPSLRILKQEDCEFKNSLVYIARPCLERRKKTCEPLLEA